METAILNDYKLDYKNLLGNFENYLQENRARSIPPILSEAANHVLCSKGKRIRPMLLLMSGKLFGANTNDLMAAALSIELYHNSTLIHDDIMDQSELRRGLLATHLKFDANTAINAGNLLTSMAFKSLLHYKGEKLEQLLKTFNQTTIQVIEGQGLDLSFENKKEVSHTEYLKMISLKTSVLLAAAAKMGAIIAGAVPDDCNKMYEFALNLGISFQLKDDYLDAFGDMEAFGKTRGGDIVQNKKTLLHIKAMDQGNTEEKLLLQQLENCNDQKLKIEKILEIFESSGARKFMELEMEKYYQKAIGALDQVAVEKDSKYLLSEFAEHIYHRTH